jgi:hypothetical protein
MKNLDEISRTLWSLNGPPLALVVAGRCSRALARHLREDARLRFEALTKALEEYWPERQRTPQHIYDNEYSQCLELMANANKALDGPMTSANIQMRYLLRMSPTPGSLPADGFYNLGVSDFENLVLTTAKAEHIPKSWMSGRLMLLLDHKNEPWKEICMLADNMGFGRILAGAERLSQRLKQLAEFADLGAVPSWSGDSKPLLTLAFRKEKRMAIIDASEWEALVRVVPWIPPPPR